MLSWSLTKPGFQVAQRVAWREVRNADLPPTEDPRTSLARLMGDADLGDAVLLVTSRDITRYHLAQATVEGDAATCLATVGLSNGERVGQRSRDPVWLPGTVNILLHVGRPLSDGAFVETVSIVAEARTAAIVDARVEIGGALVTGSGTDCIVVAAPLGEEPERFAGMHTAIGEAVGAAVTQAIREGVAVWRQDFFKAVAERKSAAE